MKVRMIAPSSSDSDAVRKLEESIEFLKLHGFDVKYNSSLLGDPEECRFYANTKEFRLQDLRDAILDEETDIIWAFRGGYGAGEIIEKSMDLAPKKKKILIGYSDITVIGVLFTQIYSMPFLHASNILSLIGKHIHHIHDIKDILQEREYSTNINMLNDIAQDGVRGVVTGGNLCMIQTLIGTKLHLQTKGKILFLEDVSEPGYKIARMLNHLEKASMIDEISGCILGDFANSDENLEYVLDEFIKRHNNIPFYKIASGHGDVNYPILMGREVSISNGLLKYKIGDM